MVSQNQKLNKPSKHQFIKKQERKKYLVFLDEIKRKIQRSRLKAYRSLNREMIKVYWDIGKGIMQRQKKFGWGKSIVERLASDLRKEFSATSGFSTQNLWYMRQFFLAYKDHPNLQRLVGEIPWGQNLAIMAKVKPIREREFYVQATREQGWTRNVLIHQIESRAYQRSRKNQHNFRKTLPKHLSEQADAALKDKYALDFMGSARPILERDLEKGLINHIRDFLIELGLGFCFVGNQYRISVKGREYFIDLLFYHRHLKCLIAIDLKIGGFKPESPEDKFQALILSPPSVTLTA